MGISLRVLSHFVNKSFLAFNRQRQRYDMHEMVRQFAAEALAEQAKLHTQTRAKHAIYYGRLLGQHDWSTLANEMAQTFESIGRERDNVRAAWLHLAQDQQFERMEQRSFGLTQCYHLHGSLAEGIQLLRQTLQRLPAEQQTLRQKLQIGEASLLRLQNEYEAAIAVVSQALEDDNAIKNPEMQALVLNELGISLYESGKIERAEEAFSAALPVAHRVENEALIAKVSQGLGNISWKQANFAEATAYYKVALAYFEQFEANVGLGATLNNLGIMAYDQGQVEVTINYFRRSAAVHDQLGDRFGTITTLVNLAVLESMAGQMVEAIDHLEIVTRSDQAAETPRTLAAATAWLGAIYTSLGDWEKAKAYLDQSLEQFEAIDSVQDLIYMLMKKSQWALLTADFDLAYTVAQRALRLAVQHELMPDRDKLMGYCGHALVGQGVYGVAAEAYQDALAFQRERGLSGLMIEPLAGLARLALLRNDVVTAKSHCEEILAIVAKERANILFDPFRIDLVCYEVLKAAEDARAAAVLEDAVGRLRARSRLIHDYALRHSYLRNVPTHRQLLQFHREIAPNA